MVRRGWDSGLDFEEAYRRILNHMLGSGSPYDVVLLVQLRNGSRVGEAVEAVRQFCLTGQDQVLVRVEKHKDNDLRLMVLLEELRSGEGRQLLSEACARLSVLRNPKAAVKVYCRRTYGFNTHSLRYAFVSYLLKRGVSPSIVAKITGHRSLDHILHYTEVRLAEEVLSGLRGWGASPAEGRTCLDLRPQSYLFSKRRESRGAALLRAARALALVLIIIVSASLLAGLSYLVPSLFHRGRIIIRAYAMGGDGDLTQLTNASFSVWAWAPTPNGTEFIPVFNGTGPQAVINLSRLVGWAKDWIHAYGKAAIRSFEPSIIIWVSYPIALPNGSVELVTQPYFQPINLSLPLSGNGTIAVNVMVSHPFRTLLKANDRGAGVAVRGLAKVSPGQTTTTTVTTTLTNITTTSSTRPSYACPICYMPIDLLLVPHVIAWYPNNESTAPISLAVALGQPSSVSEGYGNPTVTIDITVASSNISQSTINGLMIAGSAFDAAMDDYEETGNLFQAVSQLSPQLGTTFTFASEKEVAESNGATAEIPLQNEKVSDIIQLYIVGQAALVNWTAYMLPLVSNTPVSWYLGLQLTAVKVVESDGAEAPVIYRWWAYDPCINPSEWAYEQQVLMQAPSYFFGTGMNSTCPLPNTPAPVIWQDYATKLTYFTTMNPNSQQEYAYVDLSVNGGESPLGIGIDAGSAIASIIGTVLMESQPEVGAAFLVIGALLGAFQFQYHSVAVGVNTITIYNPLPYNVSVYYSNLTPAYTVSGQSFTLPKELILMNVTS